MSKTEIQWTDRTWNCVTGCDRVSSGCDHCYAATLAKRLKAMGNPRYQVDGESPTSGPGFGVTLHHDKLLDPFHWRAPQKVFVNSMSDLFHAKVPDDFIDDVFQTMANCPQHTFQILTKRPQRMFRYVSKIVDRFVPAGPLPNVWLGTSVENQEAAYRIDWLVKTPAAVRFLSCEPLIGRLDIEPWLMMVGPSTAGPWHDKFGAYRGGGGIGGQMITARPTGDLHWVIAGGESGNGFRPVDLNWLRDLRDQCQAADVPYFLKQIGGRTPKAGGRELDGRVWDQMPVVAS